MPFVRIASACQPGPAPVNEPPEPARQRTGALSRVAIASPERQRENAGDFWRARTAPQSGPGRSSEHAPDLLDAHRWCNLGRMKLGVLLFAVGLGLGGCGGDDDGQAGSGEITGRWAGTAGTDSAYLELAQQGVLVDGEACERPQMDCHPLLGATFVNRQLTGSYSWFESDGSSYTVFISLMLSANGSELAGSYTSTKCEDTCRLDALLTRQ
jgi:hypothetical protein